MSPMLYAKAILKGMKMFRLTNTFQKTTAVSNSLVQDVMAMVS